MKHWWADTLFKRLFVLMWVALVVSHLLAFLAVRTFMAPPGASQGNGMPLPPVLGALPPGTPIPGAGPVAPPGRSPPSRPPPGGLPAQALWLDYGVRFLVIGLAAWWGARWLSAPMRRLADASQALGQSLGAAEIGQAPAPHLDEARGTLEVRQTTHVFNTMAQRLREQFNAQGLLMAAISHDLRTPLARLRLRLEPLQAQPQAAACIADVREMDALIGSVLDLVRDQQTPAAPQRVDLLALMQALADDLGEQGQAVAVHGEPTVVLAQPMALGRVLGNLVGNALRHAGTAEVTVTTRHGQARLCVDDRGPGIPPGQLDAVFKPFYRLEASGTAGSSGSGLGLHIARDLLLRQGGQLTLSNRPGGGLRAEVVLPLG
jgi:signal transduction histidine kinase